MSTFIEVEHVTTYRYAKPVEFSPHKAMFRPRAAHDIRVLKASLEVSPLSQVRWIHDVFSNSVAIVEPMVAQHQVFELDVVVEPALSSH